jgi:hypothetical protein
MVSITTHKRALIEHLEAVTIQKYIYLHGTVTCDRFSLGTPVSSINKTDSHDITELLLKVALNSTNLNQPVFVLPGCGVMVSVLHVDSRWIDRGFELRSV